MSWIKITAREVVEGDILIRQVEEDMEWVPGPYGAFVVEKIRKVQDEFSFVANEVSGCGVRVKVMYDGDEEVTVKRKTH